MEELIFNEENHTYLFRGAILPSVTTIMKPLSNVVYSHIDPEVLRFAANRGTKVHAATELYDLYGAIEIEEEYTPYLDAYLNFLNDYKPEILQVEHQVYHKQLFYAGTVDRIVKLNNKVILLDIKTTSSLHKDLVSIQTTAYQEAEQSNGLHIDGLASLKLNKDGTYEFNYLERDWDTFLLLYKIHMKIKTIKERK